MIGVLIGLIVLCIVLGVLFWAAQQLLPLIPLGEPFRTILRVLLVVLVAFIVIWVFIQMLDMAGFHVRMLGAT